jgi:hypothetical protein
MNARAHAGVVELRQYTLHPGQRDTLIELFEREFIESQEACGMHLLGQFRDLDDPDRFVWLRAFDDMPARAQALTAFYGGPVWKAHRDAANATMIDSDNVLLLRPASAQAGLIRSGDERAAAGMPSAPAGLVVATVWPLRTDDADFAADFAQQVAPRWRAAGARMLASWVTEHSENTFSALPVRVGENLHVSLCAFDDMQQHAAHRVALAADPRWRDGIAPELHDRLAATPETLRLVPTPRSHLRG